MRAKKPAAEPKWRPTELCVSVRGVDLEVRQDDEGVIWRWKARTPAFRGAIVLEGSACSRGEAEEQALAVVEPIRQLAKKVRDPDPLVMVGHDAAAWLKTEPRRGRS